MENETQNEEIKKQEAGQENVEPISGKKSSNTSEEKETSGVSETADKGHDEIKSTENFKDKYYYVIAEMQNMQKRFDREKQNLLKYGNEGILNDIVDVVDNFERTLSFITDSEDKNIKNIAIGIEMIQKQLLESLEKHGLKQLNALGQSFDPNFHEAMGQEAAEGKKDEEIIKVHQNGYLLNDRLLRPAKVVIVKN